MHIVHSLVNPAVWFLQWLKDTVPAKPPQWFVLNPLPGLQYEYHPPALGANPLDPGLIRISVEYRDWEGRWRSWEDWIEWSDSDPEYTFANGLNQVSRWAEELRSEFGYLPPQDFAAMVADECRLAFLKQIQKTQERSREVVASERAQLDGIRAWLRSHVWPELEQLMMVLQLEEPGSEDWGWLSDHMRYLILEPLRDRCSHRELAYRLSELLITIMWWRTTITDRSHVLRYRGRIVVTTEVGAYSGVEVDYCDLQDIPYAEIQHTDRFVPFKLLPQAPQDTASLFLYRPTWIAEAIYLLLRQPVQERSTLRLVLMHEDYEVGDCLLFCDECAVSDSNREDVCCITELTR